MENFKLLLYLGFWVMLLLTPWVIGRVACVLDLCGTATYQDFQDYQESRASTDYPF